MMDSTPVRTFNKALEIRKKLHPQERLNGKVYLPPASYTLTNEGKRLICRCLKVSGYNTHYCHTMLSLFLAIAIRAVNHPYLKMVITCMCHFFNAISKKVIDVVELDEIRKEMRVTMC
jgi:hypothetical protein